MATLFVADISDDLQNGVEKIQKAFEDRYGNKYVTIKIEDVSL